MAFGQYFKISNVVAAISNQPSANSQNNRIMNV
jgi:hypothetical protein